jgi:hypothetical protein
MHGVWTRVFWLGLVAWISALATAAVAASFAFPTLGGLDLVLRGYTLPSDADHGHLAAGILMDRIFGFLDVAEVLAAAGVVLGSLGLWATGPRRRGLAGLWRALGVVLAVGLLGIRAVGLAPSMRGHLHAYWDAARSGDLAAAAVHRDEFRRLHPRASTLYGLTAAILTGTLILCAGGATPVRGREPVP